MESEIKLIVHTDGGSRGNPGSAGIGIVIENSNKKLFVEHGEKIGITTNNVAEYSAVLWAVKWIVKNKNSISTVSVDFFLDSELVVRQLQGVYKIKNEALRNLFFSIKKEETKIVASIRYTHVPREKNKHADTLVNKALNKKS